MRETPWHRARHKKSQDQEKRLGSLPHSRQQPNSGRGKLMKRDARIFRNFLVEARHTDKKSYSIEKQEFHDLTKQAHRTPPGCLPMMEIQMGTLRLWVIQAVDGERILEQLELLETVDDS